MKYAIGIDLGGTSIKYALIDDEGNFIDENSCPSMADVSAEKVIKQLEKSIDELKRKATEKKINIVGIGIGTPGIIDETNRIVLGGSDNIVGWSDIHLSDILEKSTGIPVYLGNDANLMGLGEQMYGAGKGFSDVVFLTVGTGIGGAVIINGKLFNGFANRGTELGHIPLVIDGKPCTCGSVGCLETYASTSALISDFKEEVIKLGTDLPSDEINGKVIMKLYHEGNKTAIQCFDRHCYYLGRGVSAYINIFSPQRIVIGGGLSESGEFYIQKVEEIALRYAMPDCAVNTKVVAATLGNRAGCAGAASFIFQTLNS